MNYKADSLWIQEPVQVVGRLVGIRGAAQVRAAEARVRGVAQIVAGSDVAGTVAYWPDLGGEGQALGETRGG